jgi:integrase
VVEESETALFWKAFDTTGLVNSTLLKCSLLLGQRPGEMRAMRREHIDGGWWTLPGDPIPSLRWPGTKPKRTHLLWLPLAVRELIAELGAKDVRQGSWSQSVHQPRVERAGFHSPINLGPASSLTTSSPRS